MVTFAISASKLGSDLKDRLEANFFRHVGHSLLLRERERRRGKEKEGERKKGEICKKLYIFFLTHSLKL